MSDAPLQGPALRWLIAVAAVSFLGALLLSVFGPDMQPVRSTGTSSYSASAIGHRALVDLLDRLGIPVLSSRYGSAKRASRQGVLVLAEPHDCAPGSPRAEALHAMFGSARNVLLVLPKWRATRTDPASGSVEGLGLRETEDAAAPLLALLGHAQVVRVPVTPGSSMEPTEDFAGAAPTFSLPVAQLVTDADIEPLVADERGILLGEVRRRGARVLVLADPDVLSNAGLHVGDNASLVVAAIEALRPPGGGVVVDETIHGHEQEPSIWRELFSFPLVLLLLHGAFTLALLLWAGVGRFGSAQREAAARPPGRQSLVANTADLLRFRGHVGGALAKYLRGAVLDARRGLRAPKGLGDAELLRWLDRMGDHRGTTERIGELHVLVTARDDTGSGAAHLLAIAGRIHRWRTEILHGPASRTRPT